MISRDDFYYESKDGVSRIHGVSWMPPQGEIYGIVQISHGMAEYIERYHEFACFLAERGILVVGSDHLGHGKSIHETSVQGFFSKQDSVKILVEDLHSLRNKIQQEYPGKPYFFVGHSMGSFLLRNYLCSYGEGLSGAVIVGTGMQSPAILKSGIMMTHFLAFFAGWRYKSRLMDVLIFGGCNKRVKNPRTAMDWLSKDETVVNHYITDERCGFTFTLNGFQTLCTSVLNLYEETFVDRMPRGLPVFFASGAEDPIGAYGKAVKKVYRQFQELGMKDVSMKLYDNDRHELLNETDRFQVYEDIVRWIQKRL